MSLKDIVANLPDLPGVYSMQDRDNQVMYIGKAKNLRKRIKSYFNLNASKSNVKTKALVADIVNIEITVTQNEAEALLLENKLINQYKPKYNIIFRDDKSYPYILISNDEFPSVRYWRGKAGKKHGVLYGPYPNNQAVRISLELLYKIFKLRSCDLVNFKNRVRPCLEFQLQRCSAPCVGFVDKITYQQDLANVKLLLQGKSKSLVKNLQREMQQASTAMNYEAAARIRDQIQALLVLQNEQTVLNKKPVDVDVIGIAVSPKLICIHVLRVRQGDVLYSRQFFSKQNGLSLDKISTEDLLSNFIIQNYGKHINNTELKDFTSFDKSSIIEILTTIELNQVELISNLVGIKITCAKSGDKFAWQQLAQNSAEEALSSRVLEYRKQKTNFRILTELLGRKSPIERIACFDVSHTQGKETVAACVVFNLFGKESNSYRIFNLSPDNPGDDYAALDMAITRYLGRVLSGVDLVPDLLLIDGGKGQLKVAERVINNLESSMASKNIHLSLLSIVKGQDRQPGLERFYLDSSGRELQLKFSDPVFKLLQRIRDAAHNFAISKHRKKRDQVIK